MNGISTRDPEEMDHDELSAEWEEIDEELIDPPASRAQENRMWERCRDLWDEMKSRIDVEAPECPECGGQRWAQEFGGPKRCRGCDKHPTDEELIQEISGYWKTVHSGEEEDSE